MSMESLIQIDSISIDLPNVTANNTGKCEHFCMRKYVSEMRQKDSKLCFPFKSGLDSSEENDALPPLNVPKFRWWQCQTCVQDIYGKTDLKEAKAVPCSSGERHQSDSICGISRSESAKLPSDFGLVLSLGNANTKLFDATVTNQENGLEHYGLPCNHEKEEVNGGTETSIQKIGPEDVLKNNLMLEIPESASVAAEVKISSGKGKHAVETVTKQSNCNGYLDAFGQGCKSPNVAAVDNSTEKILPQKEISDSGQGVEVLNACGTPKSIDMVEPVLDTLTTNKEDHASAQLHGQNDPSSDSDEICLGYNSRILSHDNSVGPQHRRIRKMRLLTDLLGENGIASRNNTLNGNSPECVAEKSAEIDAQSVKEASSIENTEKSVQKRKRKFPSFAVSRHDENVITNKEHEKSVIINRDSGISKAVVAFNKEDCSFTGIASCTVTKDNWSDQCSTIKKKKPKNDAIEGSLHNKTREAGNEAAKNGILMAGSLAFKGRGDSFLSPAQKMERHSCMCKNKSKKTPIDYSCNCRKKSKMPPADNIQFSVTSGDNGKHGEDLIPMTDTGFEKASPKNIQTLLEDNSTSEIGPDLSLGALKSDGKHAEVELGKNSSFLLQEGTSKQDQIMKRNVEMRQVEPSFPPKSVDTVLVKGAHNDVNSKGATHRTSYTNEKQRYASLMDDSQHLMLQKNNTESSFKEKSNVPLEHSTIMQKSCDKVAGMVREQGSPDDIPMEIVELMAKHQYERCQHDFEKGNISETRSQSWNFQSMSFAPEHKDGEPNLLQKESTQRKKKLKKKISGASKDFRTPQQKLIDHSSHSNTHYPSMSRVEQTYPSKRHGVFSTYQDNIKGVHSCMSGPSMHSNSLNCRTNEDMTGCKSSVPSFQSVGTCKTCHNPQQESVDLWSSMGPSSIPFAYSFPPKFGLQTNNIVSQTNRLRTPPKVNINWTRDPKILNLNATNLEKQKKNFHLEGLSKLNANPYATNLNGIDPQNSYGSIDFYNNETIPAMHLLSLMDARRPSGENLDVNKTPRFSKPSTLPRDNHSKDLLGLDLGIQKTADPLKHPSSECRAINIIPGRHHVRSSAAINIGPSSSMFQGNETFRRVTEVTAPVPPRVREKGKKKCSDLVAPAASSSLQIAFPIGNAAGKSHGCSSVHNFQRNFLGTSNSHGHAIQKSDRDKLRACNSFGNAGPLKSGIEVGICKINRNPADFSSPEVGNIYTIGAKDLRFSEKTSALDKVAMNKTDIQKQKSDMKFPAAYRQTQHQTS